MNSTLNCRPAYNPECPDGGAMPYREAWSESQLDSRPASPRRSRASVGETRGSLLLGVKGQNRTPCPIRISNPIRIPERFAQRNELQGAPKLGRRREQAEPCVTAPHRDDVAILDL